MIARCAALVVLAFLLAAAPARAWLAPVDLGAVTSPAGTNSASVLQEDGTAHTAYVNGGKLWMASRPAGGAWGAPVQLAASVGEFAFAGNGSGALAVVWADATYKTMAARWRDAGAAWSPSQTLETDGSGYAFPFYGRPAATVDPSGRATVAWINDAGTSVGGYSVRVGVRAPGGSGATVSTVTAQSGLAPYPGPGFVSVASNARGDALVAWNSFPSAGVIGTGAALSRAHGPFEPGALVRFLGGSSMEAVTPLLDAAGNATLVWGQQSGGVRVVHALDRPAGGAWASGSTLLSTPGEGAETPVAAVNATGQAVVAWYEQHGAFNEAWVAGATRDAALGAWSAPSNLTASSPALTVSTWGAHVFADGRALVAFGSNSPPSNPGYAWVLERDGGAWTPRKVSSAGAVNEGPGVMSLAGSARGDAVVVWKLVPGGGTGPRLYATSFDVPLDGDSSGGSGPGKGGGDDSGGGDAGGNGPGEGGGGDGGGGDAGGNGPGEGGGGTGGRASPLTARFARPPRLQAGFVVVDVVCNRPCSLAATASVSARVARSARLPSTRVGSGSAPRGSRRVVIRLTARARRALRGRRVDVQVVARSGAERVILTR